MKSSSEAAPAEARAGTVWITSAEPVRLRDYFLRLGAHAEMVESPSGHLVMVESADLDLVAYLNSWVTINEIDASIMERRTTLHRHSGETSRPRPRLGDLLLARGNITESQLRDALAESYAAWRTARPCSASTPVDLRRRARAHTRRTTQYPVRKSPVCRSRQLAREPPALRDRHALRSNSGLLQKRSRPSRVCRSGRRRRPAGREQLTLPRSTASSPN